ncbi:MAG: hypothetical protein L0387_15555 [Acidobacteria bacterium]|nr:hypothetical protein [Acidobacteriota bacterium]
MDQRSPQNSGFFNSLAHNLTYLGMLIRGNLKFRLDLRIIQGLQSLELDLDFLAAFELIRR